MEIVQPYSEDNSAYITGSGLPNQVTYFTGVQSVGGSTYLTLDPLTGELYSSILLADTIKVGVGSFSLIDGTPFVWYTDNTYTTESSSIEVFGNVLNIGTQSNLVTGGFDFNGLTTSRTYTLPDATGTIALTSDLASYVPYTGATGAVDLGANNLTVDTNTLFVDATNNRVGIGTTSPSAPVHLKADYVSFWGQNAIQSVTGTGNQAVVYESYYDSAGTRLCVFGLGHYVSATDPNYYFANEISGGGVIFRNASSNTFEVTSAGNVIIPGNLTVDTNTLFVDATNNFVGIGTTTRLGTEVLAVGRNQNAVTSFSVSNTTSGTAARANFSVQSNGNKGMFFNAWSDAYTTSGIAIAGTVSLATDSSNGMNIATLTASGIGFWTNTTLRATLTSGGLLAFGDGVTSPSGKLHIRGAGATKATTALYIDNSATTQIFRVNNDGSVNIGTSNTLTGTQAVVVGYACQATGANSIAIGYSSIASGTGALCIGPNAGSGNSTSAGNWATIVGGLNHRAEGNYSTIIGGLYGATSMASQTTLGHDRFVSGLGSFQTSFVPLLADITGTAQTELLIKADSGQAIIPVLFNGSTQYTMWNATITVNAHTISVGNGTGTRDDVFGGEYRCIVRRAFGSTTVTMVGSGVQTIYEDADTSMSTSVVTIDGDNATGALRVRFTPPTTAGSTTNTRVACTINYLHTARA